MTSTTTVGAIGAPCKKCNGNGAVSCEGTALPPDCNDRLLINICVQCDGSGEHEPRCGSRNIYGGICERPAGHDAGHRVTGRGACVWHDPTTTAPNLPADFDYLAKYLKRDTTVYVVVRSVARSGMSRVMSFYVPTPDGDMLFLDGLVDAVIGGRVKDGDGIRRTGCGMDMAAHTVGQLSDSLWGDYYAMRSRIL